VSLQYHGDADNYTLAGASALAHLWDAINASATNPAVAINNYGNGKAATFAFDFAKNIVLTRQGNPEWKDSEGDGVYNLQASPTNTYPPGEFRPMDMFVRLEDRIWFEPEHLFIPQADEQQRFLANLIFELTDQPVPRLWYLPGTNRSLIVNTGDGCFSSKAEKIDTLAIASDFGTFSIYLWKVQIEQEIDKATEQGWRTIGHGTGVHVSDPTQLQTYETLHNAYSEITAALQNKFEHGCRTARNHTIDWVGWVDMAKIEAEHGTRLDLNYYHYWQFSAVTDPTRFPKLKLPVDKTRAHGYFTGSGLPARFCDENGVILPI
jgi:hypothetical protein